MATPGWFGVVAGGVVASALIAGCKTTSSADGDRISQEQNVMLTCLHRGPPIG